MQRTYIFDDIQLKETQEALIHKTIKATFEELSLLANTLIKTAKENTKTREEYISFMQGAAFIFNAVCKHGETYGTSTTISSPADAINHINDLLPFMTQQEAEEHVKLVKWLNEALLYEGKEEIGVKQYKK